jgi:monoamine oxidase
MTDVLVVGAGLGGLAAGRDLHRAGCDVIVLEARDRPGGRVEQAEIPDGRVVQLGGELVGDFHTAYLGLAEELGLTLRPSYVNEPGEITHDLVDGTWCGDEVPWLTDDDRADAERVVGLFAEMARTVDPGDPWSHPDAERLDRLSINAWLREVGATANVVRAREVGALGMSGGSGERISLLAALRMDAVAGAIGTYDYDVWENQTVAEGSASVPLRMAAELGDRLRLAAPVRRIAVDGRAEVVLADGTRLTADAVVCAVPVGPLRDIVVEGLSPERMASLRRQRQARAGKIVVAYRTPFWRELGQNGLCESENLFGSTWPQDEGVLSVLVPPERLLHHLSMANELRRAEVLAALARIYDERAADPVAYLQRDWGVDPYTLGYVTQWAPGDVMAVGPLHGTHEPPFYVAGSDHWVAGYMEGAVRTGRAAAAAILGR